MQLSFSHGHGIFGHVNTLGIQAKILIDWAIINFRFVVAWEIKVGASMYEFHDQTGVHLLAGLLQSWQPSAGLRTLDAVLAPGPNSLTTVQVPAGRFRHAVMPTRRAVSDDFNINRIKVVPANI